MKARDIQNLSADELSQRIRETGAELAELRLKNKKGVEYKKNCAVKLTRFCLHALPLMTSWRG